jgi:hypothetical protein
MPSQPVLIVCILALCIIVSVIVFQLLYKIFTGKSPNLACNEVAGKFTIYAPFFLVQFRPLVTLCDILIPS